MSYILGLDPSLAKSGYVVLDTDKKDTEVEEKGLLKTSTLDGILVQRLIKQVGQIEGVIESYGISYVAMEAPFFGAGSTEILFALNQFIHRMYLERGLFVVCFPPQMLKKLVFPDESVAVIHKPHMIDRAKTLLNLHGKRLAEDVADAYWAGIFGKRFYRWYIEDKLKGEELGKYEKEAFSGKHLITRGARKGVTDYKGIIYRANELFFDFKAIKRRVEDAKKGNKEKVLNKTKKRGKVNK